MTEENVDNKITTKQQQNNTYKNVKNVKNDINKKRNERKYSDEFFNNLLKFDRYGG